MEIILNNNLIEPTAFFTREGKSYALLLVSHELLDGEMDGGPEVALDFEVSQNWEEESTDFIFEDFTISYSASGLEVKEVAA